MVTDMVIVDTDMAVDTVGGGGMQHFWVLDLFWDLLFGGTLASIRITRINNGIALIE